MPPNIGNIKFFVLDKNFPLVLVPKFYKDGGLQPYETQDLAKRERTKFNIGYTGREKPFIAVRYDIKSETAVQI